MTPFEFRLHHLFESLWGEFEESVVPRAYPASSDDKLWFATFLEKYLVLLFQDPYRFVRVVARRTNEDIRLGGTFVVNIKQDLTSDAPLVQGISGTPLLNLHVMENAHDRLIESLAPMFVDLPRVDTTDLHAVGGAEPMHLDPILSPTANPRSEITIAPDFRRAFTHVPLVKAHSTHAATTIALFYAHALDSMDRVTDWLTKMPQDVKVLPAPNGNNAKGVPARLAYRTVPHPPELLYIGTHDMMAGVTEACVCATTPVSNGSPSPVQSLCVKPYPPQ